MATEPHRVAVYATVAVVLAVAVASGPLVGAVDLTRDPGADSAGTDAGGAPGEGSVDVTIVSLPDRATLDRGKYGAAAYTLRVPDARVRLANVTGRPLVAYKIRLPALGYTGVAVHFPTAADAGPFALTMEEDTLPPDEIDRDRYEGTLIVLVRADGERTIVREPVAVDVRE